MTDPAIEPLFFGAPARPLFGTYHPSVHGQSTALTVICPPLFSEYMRVHFALRQLAVWLSEQGHDVLRFDYSGTGDSYGDLVDVTITDWLRDIRLAVEEGLALSGNTNLQILGVRCGALLACKAAGSNRQVSRFVLWDPVANGRDYLDALRRIQRTMLGRTRVTTEDRRPAEKEFSGFRLSNALVDEMEDLTSDVYRSIPEDKLRIVHTDGISSSTYPQSPQINVDFRCEWDTESEDQLSPKPVLEQLISCLTAA